MASQATLKQALICTLIEGLCLGLSRQGESDPIFHGIYERVKDLHRRMVAIMDREPGGRLSTKEVGKIITWIDAFKSRCPYIDEMQEATDIVSMLIDMVGTQLVHVRDKSKRAVLADMMAELENLLWMYDPSGEYAESGGFDAAQILEREVIAEQVTP